MRKKLGWKPNLKDERDLGFEVLGLSSLKLSEEKDLSKYLSKILNQGNTSSCVVHFIAHAIMILENKAGVAYNPVSRLFLYYNSRKYHNGQKSDSGTYIRTALKMMAKLGAPDESYWPFVTGILNSKVNKQPSWNAYMRGYSRRDGIYVTIQEEGVERLKAIETAIDAELPVGFGTDVNVDYLDDEGPDVVYHPAKNDEIAGGHAQTIIGYDKDTYKVLNSWGNEWRTGGTVRMDKGYMLWKNSRDFQVFKNWRRLLSA